VIWGGERTGQVALDDGAILDLVTNKWKKLPKPPVTGRFVPKVILCGSRLLK
jgi:hypothetical protein